MPKQSARQYYDELSDLVFGEEGNSKRANKIYDILEKRGYESWQIDQNIAAGLGLPSKEEFKKEHAKLNMTDEELRMIFDFSDVLSYNLTQFVIDIQSKKNELGGKLFAKKYILTSITCESYKYKNNRIITYEIEGPTSANDSRNKTYEYIVEYEVDKVSIGLPLDLDNCSDCTW